MNEFISIVQNNLEKAQAASEKKKEIDVVLKNVSRAVEIATNELVSIAKVEAINGFTDGLLKSLSLFVKDSKKTTLLVLRHASSPSIRDIQIAIWEESALGYPCSVAFAGREHRCTSKAALIIALKQMLADPQIGMAIEKLRAARPSIATPQSALSSVEKRVKRENTIEAAAVAVQNPATKGIAKIKTTTGEASRSANAAKDGIKKQLGSSAKAISKQAPKSRGPSR